MKNVMTISAIAIGVAALSTSIVALCLACKANR